MAALVASEAERRRYHPDLNTGNAEAEARFKLISAANDRLSDPDKRAREIDAAGQERAQPEAWGAGEFAVTATHQAKTGYGPALHAGCQLPERGERSNPAAYPACCATPLMAGRIVSRYSHGRSDGMPASGDPSTDLLTTPAIETFNTQRRG